MPAAAEGEVQAALDRAVEDGLRIVQEVMPAKIISLNQQVAAVSAGAAYAPGQLLTIPAPHAGVVECNQPVLQLLDSVKAEIRDLLQNLTTLRLWVRLRVPQMADGGNFGVSVQEDVLSTIDHGRLTGTAVYEAMVTYSFRRGKLVTLAQKHPGAADYVRAVQETDERQYTTLVQACVDLRNTYSALYDKISKNMDRITAPRPGGDAAMAMVQ